MPEQRQDPLPGYLGLARHNSLRDLFFDFEFTLISCVYWRNRAPWFLEERTCPDTFFLFPVVGELQVTLGGKSVSIVPGQFLMLPEKVSHVLKLKSGFKRLEQISVHCQIHDRWGRPLLARFPGPRGGLADRQEMVRTLKELAYLMAHDPAIGHLYGETVLKSLLASQIRQGATLAPSPEADARVGTVIRRMEDELASPGLSIEELARGVNITAVQLRKLFWRATGTGPKQFLIGLRLRRATQLLRHTLAAVKQVAADCGFASDHYFHLAFRQEFGCTPSQYRTKTSAEI